MDQIPPWVLMEHLEERRMIAEMYSEADEKKYNFDDEYEGIMTNSLSSPSDAEDLGLGDFVPSPPNYFIQAGFDSMTAFTDDVLCPTTTTKYDIDRQPHLFNLVPPNDILPVETLLLDSLTEPYIKTNYGCFFSTNFPGINDIPGDITDVSDRASPPVPESLELMHDVTDQFHKIINEITKDGASLDEIIEEDILPFIAQSSSNSNDSTNMCQKTYHPDYDHCYFTKATENKDDLWRSIGSPDDSSGSSSEEVDVVTVTEEIQTPFVPKVQVPFRKRQKRGQKSQKSKKNSFSQKTFSAAMKRNMTRNSTTVRRTYKRKINNSVETTPSNSLPSSAPSSRCSSDVEDAGKRANHNSSERKRREVLRTALQNLRLCVPSVQNNPKAPKVQILNCAKEYIREMKLRDQECAVIKKNLRSKRRSLEMKFKSLAAEFISC